jgi:hypothetical protein
MALIDSLAGVTEISDNLYEVTSVINIGSGIDDVSDSTFIMKDGGLLKWTTGCTTTFTNCIFHETETALALGSDNFQTYQAGYPPRFNGGTSPVFKGCQWICNTSARSDFDTTPDAAPTFEADEKGQKCRIIVRNDFGLQFNHLTSGDMTIDGLIIDQDGGGAAAEFALFPESPTQWNDLEVINYEGTSQSRHVSFLLNNLPTNAIRTFNRLNCRNVALINNTTATIRAVDPIGRIEKTNDVSFSDDGRWEVYRTYGGNFVDAVTGNSVSGRGIYYNSNDTIIGNEYGVSFSTQLLQYSQDFDTVDIVTEGDYTEVLHVYGYSPQTRTFTLQDEINPEANISAITPVFADPNITESSAPVVRDYTQASNADNLYDLAQFFKYRSASPYILGDDIITAIGSTLNLDNHSMIVDPTFDFAFGYTGGTNLAVTGTPSLSRFVSMANLKDNVTEGSAFSESDFQSVLAANNAYQLNSYVFNDTGSKVFAFGTSTSSDSANVILEYALSTAYDLATATLTTGHGTGFINGQQGQGTITPDGTQIIWSKRWGNWYTINLTTPWDLSTAQATVTVPFTSRRTSVAFNHDGTKLYTSRDSQSGAGNYIYQYTLSTPYDITTRGAESSFYLGASPENGTTYENHRRFDWFLGGNYAYFNDAASGTIYILKASTAYEISGLTVFNELDVGATTHSAVEAILNRPKFTLINSINSGGTYTTKQYELHQNIDFNGSPQTIYVNSTNLLASDKFDRILSAGTVTFQNGASTDMTVQDANGLSLAVTVTNLVPSSRIQLYNVTKDAELSNEIVSGTTYTFPYLAGVVDEVISEGDEIRIRLACAASTTAYDWFETSAFANNSGVFSTATQKVLAAYSQLGIDGSTVTEFTLDNPNIEVDLQDPNGQSQKRRLVAWLYYIVANDADGMRNFFKCILLQDSGNALIDVNLLDLKVDNVGSQQCIFTDTDFYLYRSDGSSWVKFPSSGNYGITSDSGKVYIAETGVSGLTSAEATQLFAIPTESSGGGATAQEIRQEIDSNSTQLASIKSTVEAIPTDNTVDLTGVTDGLDVINRGVQKASKAIPHSEDIS